ncbi:hypothetical protein B0H67DRAFT_562907 [Lasiosphaeris hirsuta]|uniref:Uncharacterized protein n=1 Tax=Lasiosphaeris hirsuta TaxID=260670 RepID=A0AA40EA72_9PEZI|nr:hypothetical protein B0H67DRAFT_562907 [Lasiosphaeris hirsuta]
MRPQKFTVGTFPSPLISPISLVTSSAGKEKCSGGGLVAAEPPRPGSRRLEGDISSLATSFALYSCTAHGNATACEDGFLVDFGRGGPGNTRGRENWLVEAECRRIPVLSSCTASVSTVNPASKAARVGAKVRDATHIALSSQGRNWRSKKAQPGKQVGFVTDHGGGEALWPARHGLEELPPPCLTALTSLVVSASVSLLAPARTHNGGRRRQWWPQMRPARRDRVFPGMVEAAGVRFAIVRRGVSFARPID